MKSNSGSQFDGIDSDRSESNYSNAVLTSVFWKKLEVVAMRLVFQDHRRSPKTTFLFGTFWSKHIELYLTIRLSISESIYLSIDLSICLSIYSYPYIIFKELAEKRQKHRGRDLQPTALAFEGFGHVEGLPHESPNAHRP